MARLPDPPLVSEPVRSDDEYRRLFWVSAATLVFITVCAASDLLPITSLIRGLTVLAS